MSDVSDFPVGGGVIYVVVNELTAKVQILEKDDKERKRDSEMGEE